MYLAIPFKKGKKDMNEHEFWKERRRLEEMPFDDIAAAHS